RHKWLEWKGPLSEWMATFRFSLATKEEDCVNALGNIKHAIEGLH
ncbi:unnamed protein product, partial [marine sediment metagenome]